MGNAAATKAANAEDGDTISPLPNKAADEKFKSELKTTQEVLRGADLKVALHNAITFMSLKKFMARTFCEENLLFYKAVEDLRATDLKSPDFQPRLEFIESEYLRQGADNEININGKTRTKILEAIKTLNDARGTDHEIEFDLALFDGAQNQIFMMISTNSWGDFLRSDECKKIMEGRRSASIVEAHNTFDRKIIGATK